MNGCLCVLQVSERAACDAVDSSDFERMSAALQSFDEQREKVIKKSRDIGKLSKQAIFSLHRGQAAEAAARLEAAQEAAQELLPLIRATPALRSGSYAHAVEEVRLPPGLAAAALPPSSLACIPSSSRAPLAFNSSPKK